MTRGLTIRTPETDEEFLRVLATGASVSKAAAAVGVTRRTAYDWKDGDPDFAAKWQDCYETGTDRIEDEAVRRGVDGVDKPVFYQGDVCGYIREYSDMLLDKQLRARRRDKYSDKTETNLTATVHVTRVVYTGGEDE